MKSFIVYTAITQGYDTLSLPCKLWRNEADFVAFLDKPQSDPGWEIRPIYKRFGDPCRNAKIHKLLPHKYFPNAEYSLWIDGSVSIKSTLALHHWVKEYLAQHDLAVFKHRFRKCCYQEALECIHSHRDSTGVIDRQMQKYRDAGYPINNGLAECTVLLRRHSKKIKDFNETWYQEVKKYSRRDQLSFNYAAHKVGLKYSHLPGNIADNVHFDWLPHLGIRQSHFPESTKTLYQLDKPDVVIISHKWSGAHQLISALTSHPKIHSRGEFLFGYRLRHGNQLANFLNSHGHLSLNRPGFLNIGIIAYAEVGLYTRLFGSLDQSKIIHLLRSPTEVTKQVAQIDDRRASYVPPCNAPAFTDQARRTEYTPQPVIAPVGAQSKIEFLQKRFIDSLATHPNILTVNYDEFVKSQNSRQLSKALSARIIDLFSLR